MAKTNGLEFKRFYGDNEWTPAPAYFDDEELTVNGTDYDPSGDISAIPDDAVVIVRGGAVLELPNGAEPSVESHFRAWKREQTKIAVVVEIDRAKFDLLVEAIRSVGGKVIQ